MKIVFDVLQQSTLEALLADDGLPDELRPPLKQLLARKADGDLALSHGSNSFEAFCRESARANT